MLPYRPPEIKEKQQRIKKPKPIPSLQLTHTLNLLCEGTQNTYDSKNHILTINDLSKFEAAANSISNRSLKSLERQLKKLGFKLRRYRRNEEDNQGEGGDQIRVYKWKGKKQLLIDEQLSLIQTGLAERKMEMQSFRQQIRRSKKIIDSEIQSIILSMVVDFNSDNAKKALNNLLGRTRIAVNSSEVNMRKIINKISTTMGNQLQLYKLLIYKEGVFEKKTQEREQEGEINDNSDHSEQNNVIQEQDSAGSLVSIEMAGRSGEELNDEGLKKIQEAGR